VAAFDLNEPKSSSFAGMKFYKVNVSDNLAVKRAVRAVNRDFGGMDILVNSAGIDLRGTVTEMKIEEWKKVFDVNLYGTFIVSRHVIPYLIRRGGGSIINMTSVLGILPGPAASAYCASKSGIISLTKSMALDYMKNKIRVNCVAPGAIDTPMFWGANRKYAELVKKGKYEDRLGTPEEIAQGIYFLASKETSSYVTGSVLTVDGGSTSGFRW
jgi:NAD(P)-dependent dehydrogenase (short-subunit alcohol dehydrogenase family)